jgi:putative endonuclease
MFGRKKDLGAAGEDAARRFLRREGFRIIAKNYRCPLGEIDLIALDGETIVFVEVKTRSSDDTADPENSIGSRKQTQLTRVARYWLHQHRYPDRPYRFDAVSVVLGPDRRPEVRRIEDAFVPRM